MGVPVAELRAALAEARLSAGEVEWSGALWELLWSRLTKRQQWVVFLHVFGGLPLAEVGRRRGIGRGAVDGVWRRALERIKDALPAASRITSPRITSRGRSAPSV
jgi:DNA-directed RNA polymerase specialized sigma24 family protein